MICKGLSHISTARFIIFLCKCIKLLKKSTYRIREAQLIVVFLAKLSHFFCYFFKHSCQKNIYYIYTVFFSHPRLLSFYIFLFFIVCQFSIFLHRFYSSCLIFALKKVKLNENHWYHMNSLSRRGLYTLGFSTRLNIISLKKTSF